MNVNMEIKSLEKFNQNTSSKFVINALKNSPILKRGHYFLAKQILSLSNKMIEKSPEFNDEQSIDKSIKLWYDCNTDVLEQLKKINLLEEGKENNVNTTKDETNYNFDQILHETEIDGNQNEQELDGKNLHDLYRHSTKLIK